MVVYQFNAGFCLAIGESNIAHDPPPQFQCGDAIEFHYTTSGASDLTTDGATVKASHPSLLVLRSENGRQGIYEVASAAPDSIRVSLYCSHSWLSEAFDNAEPLPNVLGPMEPQLADADRFRLTRCFPGTTAVLEALVRDVVAPLAPVMVQAKALELLCLSVSALRVEANDEPQRLRLTAQDRANLERAWNIVRVEFANPPNLNALARRVGLNTTKLPWGFKRVYGLTIQEFIKQCRLERAQDLLCNTDLQISRVAMEVGYRHHSTFTTAFVSHFGCSPKTLARVRASLI